MPQAPSNCPPSTAMIWPVTQRASGEARKSATSATSSGRPRRPNGNALQYARVDRIVGETARLPVAAGKLDRTRGDAVHADFLARQHAGLTGRVMHHRRLDGAIGRHAQRRTQSCDRRDVDDAAARRGLEVRQRGARGTHHRHDIHGQSRGPSGLVVTGAEPGSIVDEHVDATEHRCRLAYIARHGLAVGEVTRRCVHFAAVAGDVAARRLQAAPRCERRSKRRRRPPRSPARSPVRCLDCLPRQRRACP